MLTVATPESEAELIRNRNASISSLRAQYPHLTYSEARDQVRNREPALFGLDRRVAAPAVVNQTRANNRAESLLGIKSPRALAVEEYAVKNRCSHEVAWRAVQRARPELWTEKGDSSAGFVVNRCIAGQPDDVTLAGQIADAIAAMQERNPKLSYSEARDLCRRESPEIFGISKP